MRRGIATFTLDGGKCPPWLWKRMVNLGREMVRVLIEEFGPDEFIKRIADPVWFQSLGTVLAFDWNASGLTTILTAALKESIRGAEKDYGIFIAGGKGKTSRKTPSEIMSWGETLQLPAVDSERLVYNSKMTAKVDSALVQDGFQIYHHTFFFSRNGMWAVVQQGMNKENRTARRYHWFSEHVDDLIVEPHAGIVSDRLGQKIDLNMTAKGIDKNRNLAIDLVNSGYETAMKDIQLLRRHYAKFTKMVKFKHKENEYTLMNMAPVEFGPFDLPVADEDFSRSKYLEKVLAKVTFEKPDSYEQLLATEGVGPKTIRALALVGEVIYGANASYEDPARYSFAHGGKDASPYPVDRQTYDATIQIMRAIVSKTKLEVAEKNTIDRRLNEALQRNN
ncbi:MAG: DUF763 domain-containing protein [Candidatus Doudnabacteria bacterium]|nr:DUF763 domain-containing protein [Candidatus Doudnabacteria bacterium]